MQIEKWTEQEIAHLRSHVIRCDCPKRFRSDFDRELCRTNCAWHQIFRVQMPNYAGWQRYLIQHNITPKGNQLEEFWASCGTDASYLHNLIRDFLTFGCPLCCGKTRCELCAPAWAYSQAYSLIGGNNAVL